MRWLILFAPWQFAALSVAGAQTSKPAVQWSAPDSWLAAQSPRCGEVVGRILRRAAPFDAADTQLLPLANASAAAPDSGIRYLSQQRGERWTVTDTSGEFRLQLPENRTMVFEVRAIGFDPIVFALDGKRYRAAVVEIGLASSGSHASYGATNVLAERGLTACTP
jgi:hypothetical protein